MTSELAFPSPVLPHLLLCLVAAPTQEGIIPSFAAAADLVQGGASVQLLLIPAVVSMGSADHRLNLAEILSQNYGVREEREEEDDTQEKQKSLEELEKSFGASQVKAVREGKEVLDLLLDLLHFLCINTVVLSGISSPAWNLV